ncbi:hypothetical protein EFE42_00490 [Methanohalophilus sp. RSK]|uniref:hypothetical protein n=1 Tax=Methanohalophilus sp. RSK TaxID=2485783 RepID=UPI000F43DF71|nr:hypothetical protein [Methanohalophilus sp. RSK]RNI15757.1 hypothetical protein EFE42_00490 [Methanohalophilus sp. RSK]
MQRNHIINATIPDRPFFNDSDGAWNTPAEPDHDLLIDAGAKAKVHDPHVLQYPDVEVSRDLDCSAGGCGCSCFLRL